MKTLPKTLSETPVDAAFFIVMGSLGHRLVEHLKWPVPHMTPGQYVAGGLINAAFVGIGNTLFRNDSTPWYKKTMILTASLAVGTFSAPHMTKALESKTGFALTYKTAMVLGAFHFICKMANNYFSRTAHSSSLAIQASFLKELRRKSEEEIRGLHTQVTERKLDWSTLPFATQIVMKSCFDYFDFPFQEPYQMSFRREDLDLLTSTEIDVLHHETADLELSAPQRTLLNNFLFENSKPTQIRSTDGNFPEKALKKFKNFNLRDSLNLQLFEIDWLYEFRERLGYDEGTIIAIRDFAESVFEERATK